MNRTLISALDAINNLLAIGIIVVSTFAGYATFPGSDKLVGLLLGLVGGFITAAVVCGLLAIFIEIEKHLRQLVAARPAGLVQPTARIEPGLARET